MSYRDAGVYGCHAGHSISELRLRVKPKPGDREPTPADYESVEEEEDIDDLDMGDIDEDDEDSLNESREGILYRISTSTHFYFLLHENAAVMLSWFVYLFTDFDLI